MPPKSTTKRVAPRHGPLAPEEGTATGYMKATYEAVTARENLGVIRAVGIFGVAVAFFHSSWSDILLPA
ncbi:hypothetical protein G7Y79_00012g032710 [Physcia stellaris]|nr:hypothetical protein G7Y79_00012g032710 [Physcia stellaris]